MNRWSFRSIAAVFLYATSIALTGCGSESSNDSPSGDDSSSGGGPADNSFPGYGGELTATAQGVFTINELMPANSNTIQDEGGAFPDWIEIHNAADGPASLANFWLGDDPDPPDRLRTQLTEDLVVPAHGVILLFADSDPEQGSHHLTFDLGRAGEWVVLSDPNGAVIDSIQWDSTAPQDESYARTEDGGGTFVWCQSPTPGRLNGSSCSQ